MLSPCKFPVSLSKSSSSRLVWMLFPLVTHFISPATPVCTDTIYLTLISVVASSKSPKQTQWARLVHGRSRRFLFPLLLFFFFLFLFSLTGTGSFFSVFCIGFLYLFLAFILLCALAGQFFVCSGTKDRGGFLLSLLRFISSHFCLAVFHLQLPLLFAFYVLPSSIMCTCLHHIPS